MVARPPVAVLLMAYGSAPSLAERDVRAYLTHILQFYRNSDPTDDEVEDLRARYEAVGGSPLYEGTRRLVAATQAALNKEEPAAYRVRLAMKHSPPFIEEVVRAIAAEGAVRAVGVALAPFRSRLSTEGYLRLVRETNAGLDEPVEWAFAGDWHLHPRFLDLWQERIEERLEELDQRPVVVFTNHSLPARVRDWHDPYEGQFRATAEALAARCGLTRWSAAYQSEGGGGVPWLGPGLDAALAEWKAKGAGSVLVVPIGFLMDHLEVLYDVDIAARQRAQESGIALHRTRMPNDDPRLVALLGDIVRRAAGATHHPGLAVGDRRSGSPGRR